MSLVRIRIGSLAFRISFSSSLGSVDGSSELFSLTYKAAAGESESLSQDRLEEHRSGSAVGRAWTLSGNGAAAKEAIVDESPFE